jgi:hypothetical protein
MRYVLMVGAVLAVVGCGSVEPAPIEPTCEVSEAVCPEGMAAFCDGEGAGELATLVIPGDGTCVAGRHEVVVIPVCDGDGEVECDFYTATCVETPSTDPDDCARWNDACEEMGGAQCYVPTGTDDVIPLF